MMMNMNYYFLQSLKWEKCEVEELFKNPYLSVMLAVIRPNLIWNFFFVFLQYSVQDAVSSELLGYFFLDLYPRDGKYGHACMMPLQPGYKKDKGMKEMDLVNICVMLANFSKPTDKKPALLGK